MKIRAAAGLMAAALAVTAFTPIASAQFAKPVVQAGYHVPRLSNGRPEIQGTWTNATSTPLQREAKYGDRLAYTAEEAAEIEGTTAARNARINAPTSEEVTKNWKDLATGPDKLDECRGGSLGVACGYNAGWTDPGDLIMRVHGEPRTSMITFPANGRMPARVNGGSNERRRPQVVESSEEGPGRAFASQNDNPETRSLGERCIMSFGISSGPVMTPQLYNNTYKIVQAGDTVAIWVEMVHDVRVVRIGGKHRMDGITPWMGDSIGWWDGDTLVVETTNFNPKQNLRGGDENLKVTERFTRVDADRLLYQFMVEDPTVWTEAWGGEYEFNSAPGIYEYACHEGNYGLEGILAGAREEERQAAEAAKPTAAR